MTSQSLERPVTSQSIDENDLEVDKCLFDENSHTITEPKFNSLQLNKPNSTFTANAVCKNEFLNSELHNFNNEGIYEEIDL